MKLTMIMVIFFHFSNLNSVLVVERLTALIFLKFIFLIFFEAVLQPSKMAKIPHFQLIYLFYFMLLLLIIKTYQIKHTFDNNNSMNPNQSQGPFIDIIQDEWLKANANLQSKRAQYTKAMEVNEELKQQTSMIQQQIVDKLKKIRQSFMDKLIQLKQIKQLFDSEHAILTQQQLHSPKPQYLFGDQKLNKLEMCLQNPLKFDCLIAKIQRIGIECQNRTNALKDQIKKIKLRMSLCEMEYKDLVNPAKRKSD